MLGKGALELHRAKVLPEDVNLDADALALYRDITDDRVLRALLISERRRRWYRNRSTEPATARTLTLLGEEMIDLRNAKAPAATAYRFVVFLDSLHATLWPTSALRDLPALDRDDHLTDYAEQSLELKRHTEGATPDELRQEADANERQACASIEKARKLRAEADRRDREQGIYQRPMGAQIGNTPRAS